MGEHEEKASWKNGALTGEGLWRKASGNKGVVICHPHPLMGGSMHNNVVEAVRDAFGDCGYSTLRFNFRGVGQSTGRYDEGNGEKQDILSACAFLKNSGVEHIALAGYSFGAWVCSRLLKDKPMPFALTVFISPPQKYFEFDWTGLENAVDYMICGDSDDFVDVADLERRAAMLHAEFKILKGTDHFFGGRETQLTEKLKRFIEKKA